MTYGEDNFDELKSNLERAHRKGLESVGLLISGDAQLRTPVDTGMLKGSINHRVSKDSVIIGTNVEYSEYVEYGTSRTPAQPYLRPALYENEDKAKKIYADCIREATE